MAKTATPPTEEQLKALAELLAASQMQARTRRTERRLTAFYLTFGLVMFVLAALSGWWG